MAPTPSGILERCQAYISPLVMIGLVFLRGFGPAVVRQLSQFSAYNLLSPSIWWQHIFSAGFPVLLEDSNQNWAPVKGPLLAKASGKVLEVGAGAGHTVRFYDNARIDHVYGVEPYKGLHDKLQLAIKSAKLQDKYTIVPYGIDDSTALEKSGVHPGTFDTVVLVQVLCSIPEPQRMLPLLQKFLKPGGRMIVFEHVESNDLHTKIVQRVWTYSIWRRLFEGCELTRPTGRWLADLGGWKSVEPISTDDDIAANMFPHCVGVYTKA